jgi:PAS domain S-box-containing protein
VSVSADSRTNLLLVDDRRENLIALEAILEPLGQNLVKAESGFEALRHLLTMDFALILLDVQMPELDGFETAKLIKERERTRWIPIIFLTAISKEPQNVFQGYDAGAVDYIFKPFDPEILRSKVSVFIDLHRKTVDLQRASETLRERELAEFRRNLAESMPQIVWTTRPDGRPEYFNQRWTDYTGVAGEDAVAGTGDSALHPDDRARTAERWRHCVATGEEYEIEHRFRRASDDSFRWHLSRGLPMRDEQGTIVGWVGTATDIDDQKRATEAQRFLVQASSVLGSSLDYRSTLTQVARLAVPDIADWCGVDILEEDGSTRQLAVAHSDPLKVAFAKELSERYPSDPSAPQGAAKAVQTGEAELVPLITDEMIEASARDELHLQLIRELGLRSYMCVPMVARGRTLGALTFVAAESGRVYGEADLELAEELARRAATAVDNAELYRRAEERAQAAQVLATVGDGVCLVDGAGVVRLWNPAAEAITGLAAAEVTGRRADEVLPGWTELAPRVPVSSDPGTASTRATTGPVQIGDRELWLSFSGVGFEGGTVYAFRDLTEERALESMRQEFVATVSHELRTPLAAIYGSAITIRRADIDLGDDMRDQLLGVIAEESDRLAQIVNDLLLASHLDSGRLHVSTERCDGRALAEQVIDAARTHAAEGVELELDAPDGLPPVEADPGQLQQVLTNIVDNAIKYSPEGGTIAVQLAAKDRFLRFAVVDHGLGIPVSEHARIFEKFYRLDPDMTRGIGGTGLGLYICRELVRRVDGRLWVESQEGKGSTFNVEIPLAGGAAAADAKGAANRTVAA